MNKTEKKVMMITDIRSKTNLLTNNSSPSICRFAIALQHSSRPFYKRKNSFDQTGCALLITCIYTISCTNIYIIRTTKCRMNRYKFLFLCILLYQFKLSNINYILDWLILIFLNILQKLNLYLITNTNFSIMLIL